MKIKIIKVGSLQTNCYIVSEEKSNQAMVIDPGAEAEKILLAIKDLNICAIVITHGHPDHFGGLDQIKQATNAPIYMNPEDNWFLVPEKELKDNDELKCGDLNFKIIHTPGHTPGCICLYTKGHLFSGDTLFYDTYGRVDLPGSSPKKMKQSLKRLGTLPDDTVVYPGHGDSTTIKDEKERGTIG